VENTLKQMPHFGNVMINSLMRSAYLSQQSVIIILSFVLDSFTWLDTSATYSNFGGLNFRQYFFADVHLSHPLISVHSFTVIVPGRPPSSVKRKRVVK